MIPTPEFNLVRDSWLPVTTRKGATEEWGLREFFHRAHQAKAFNDPSPLNYTAVLRLLLAIAHRAHNGPKSHGDWLHLWSGRDHGFDRDTIDAYLDRWEHRFNLFDPVAPFGQVTDFDEDVEGSPLSRLILEYASGSNTVLFNHSRDDQTPTYPASVAARALIAAQQYAFAGAQGHYMQAPMIAGYAISWEGKTLYETLVLNMVRYGGDYPRTLANGEDAPFWETNAITVPNKVTRPPNGLTDLYTFQARRLQLIPNEDCSVSLVRYRQGYVLDLLNESIRDPFKRYLEQKSAEALLPRNFNENRALWRDADGLLQTVNEPGEKNEPPTVLTDLRIRMRQFRRELADTSPNIIATGLVNNQARISLWRMDRMKLPLSIIDDDERIEHLHDAIRLVDDAWSSVLRQAGGRYANVFLSGSKNGADGDDVATLLNRISMSRRYWSQLDRKFQSFLADLGSRDDLENVSRAWKVTLRRHCQTVYRESTTSLVGVRDIQAQSEGAVLLAMLLNKNGLGRQEQEAAI